MELQTAQASLLAGYLGHCDQLIGDKRTGVNFREVVSGIISAGSLICQRIAAHIERPLSDNLGALVGAMGSYQAYPIGPVGREPETGLLSV